MTIAVVAERSEVRISGLKEAAESDSEDESPAKSKKIKQGDKELSQKDRDMDKWRKRRGPRKYINIKLVSLPSRGKKETAGDAQLQLLLFEADAKLYGKEVEQGDKKGVSTKTVYQGGSGGAYEKWCNLMEGTVIALLNPRVLRPLRVSISQPASADGDLC